MKVNHPEPTVDIRTEGSTTVIALAGQLRGTLSAAQRDRILAAIQPDRKLLLDFSEVEHISGTTAAGENQCVPRRL